MKITRLLNLISKVFGIDYNKIVNSNVNRLNKMVVNLFKNNKSKNLTYMLNIEVTEKPTFLFFNAKKIFNYLKQAFIKALIF